VGSLARASQDAARSLAMSSNVRHVSVAPRILLHDSARACRIAMMHAVVEGLEKGDDVLVELLVEGEPDLSLGTSLAEKLGSMLELAANHMGGLIVTGGETAAAVLRHLGIRGIRLLDEIEPGLCLGFTLGEVRVPIVTKSGAFGDAESLIRIATYLRQLGTSIVRETR
jgi:D-threonate/D-erythronate kinase